MQLIKVPISNWWKIFNFENLFSLRFFQFLMTVHSNQISLHPPNIGHFVKNASLAVCSILLLRVRLIADRKVSNADFAINIKFAFVVVARNQPLGILATLDILFFDEKTNKVQYFIENQNYRLFCFYKSILLKSFNFIRFFHIWNLIFNENKYK